MALENPVFHKYNIKKQKISEREVFVLPKEYLKYEWENMIHEIGWKEENVRKGFVDVINSFEKVPLYLGIVSVEMYQEPYHYIPALVFYREGKYHLVAYKKEWFCRNCMVQSPRQFNGFKNVLMPLFEHEPDCYPDRKYPAVPDFFEKKICSVCGYPMQEHLFCLNED